MVIPFHAALQHAQAEGHWSPSTMAKMNGTPRSTMYRWLNGESVPDSKSIILACQVFGINPEKVLDGRAPKYHKQVLSLDSLQATYQAQFSASPIQGDLSAITAAAVVFHTAMTMEVMCELRLDSYGGMVIIPKDPNGPGYKIEITTKNGSLVVVVKTSSDTVLSTEILSDAAVKTAVEMIA